MELGQVLYLSRAPRTKETLPDFREWCRVTRHPRVFRGLTGCQRTPREWGVTNGLEQVVDTWRDVNQVFKVIDMVKNKVLDKIYGFSASLNVGEKEGDKEINPSLLSMILGLLSIGIRQAKN